MKHTIISWDCSYRNFFHLIDALLDQDYDKNSYEFIYVEQREKDFADQYNHKTGLKSLSDRLNEVGDKMQLRVEYLGDPPDVPYHLGRTVNHGLALARGEIVSVMDGDMLLSGDFLNKLDEYHANEAGVVNLERLMATEPVGVPRNRWTEAVIDYDRCLDICEGANAPLPRTVVNKGPMISAHRGDWEAVNGYDEHVIWSTGLTKLGMDVTARLEMHCRVESTALPDRFAVHPYHPEGFSRVTLDSARLLAIQGNLIKWAKEHKAISWSDRTDVTERVYQKKIRLIERMLEDKLSRPDKGSWESGSLFGSSVLFGKIYNKTNRLLSLFD